MSYAAEQEGKHWKGWFIFDDETVETDFPDLKFDPDFGVVEGTSQSGYQISGVVDKRGSFNFKLIDSEFNERQCWGKMSQDRKKIQGCWGYEIDETEDQFKLKMVDDDDNYGDEAESEYNSDEYEEDYEQENEGSVEAKSEEPSSPVARVLKKGKTGKQGRPVGLTQMRKTLGSKFNKIESFAKAAQQPNPLIDEAIMMVAQIIDAGEEWTDPDFPPNQNSIQVPGEKPNASRQYEWKRAKDIFEPGFVVFNEDIDPNDINQGELGNCYYLAVLSACAEDSDRIKNRIKTQEVNAAGIYCVTMYINGVETPIIVDDWFPTVYGKPAFCKTKENELWAMLFEKAWAKVHGSFMRTEGGQTAHASQHMIGLPAFTIDHKDLKNDKDIDNFFKKLQRYDEDQFVMLASSTAGTNDEFVDGIVQGHAYALLSVHSLYEYGRNWDLVKLRNPWGKGEWTGAWSDNSELWTEELKNYCGIVEADDGIFCIPVEEYITHFSQTSVSVTIAEHLAVSETKYEKDSTKYFQFTLKDDQNRLAVTACQQGDRLMKYRPKDRADKFAPSPFSMVLIDESNNIVGSSREKTMSNFFHSLVIEKPIIQSGKYTLIVDVSWDGSVDYDNGFDDVLVRIFTGEKVEIEDNATLGQEVLAEAFKARAQESQYKASRAHYREDDPEYGDKLYRINDSAMNVGFYSCILRQNNSAHVSNEKLAVTLTGMHFVGENTEDFEEIASGSSKIFVMRCDEAFGSTSYGMSMAWKSRSLSDAEMVVKCREKESQALTGDVSYKMMLTDQGGCMVFENSDSENAKKIGVNIDGSQNLRIDGGDTFVEKSITVQPNNRNSVIMKLLTDGTNPSLQCGFTCSNVPGANVEEVEDQWTQYVDGCWPKFDTDGSGELEKEEAMKFCRQLFTGSSPAEFERYFAIMDIDNSGAISKSEMAHFMRQNCS